MAKSYLTQNCSCCSLLFLIHIFQYGELRTAAIGANSFVSFLQLQPEFPHSRVAALTGGRNTGNKGNRPARRLPRPGHHYTDGKAETEPLPEKWVHMGTNTKKDASRVPFFTLGLIRPAADFAVAGRKYQGMVPARKPLKVM